MKKTQGKDLSPNTRKFLTVGGITQLLLFAASNRDLSRRSASEVRGRKGMWRILTLVNFVGPISYFMFGRRKR